MNSSLQLPCSKQFLVQIDTEQSHFSSQSELAMTVRQADQTYIVKEEHGKCARLIYFFSPTLELLYFKYRSSLSNASPGDGLFIYAFVCGKLLHNDLNFSIMNDQ